MQAAGGPALVCRRLEPYATHLFTTRPWRLGSAERDGTSRAWDEVAEAIGAPDGRLVRVHQVHGTAVFVADEALRGAAVGAPAVPAGTGRAVHDADIILTRTEGLALAIQTADCVPLLIADRDSGVVAAVHAGWRGLAAGAPREAVRALERRFGSRPDSLIAAIGPAVGACCYQVGPDVRAAFGGHASDAQLREWFTDTPADLPDNPPIAAVVAAVRRPDRWFFDGWSAARAQLEAAGVAADRIFAARLCTASHADVFCSYRRDGPPAGRLAAVVRCDPRP